MGAALKIPSTILFESRNQTQRKEKDRKIFYLKKKLTIYLIKMLRFEKIIAEFIL